MLLNSVFPYLIYQRILFQTKTKRLKPRKSINSQPVRVQVHVNKRGLFRGILSILIIIKPDPVSSHEVGTRQLPTDISSLMASFLVLKNFHQDFSPLLQFYFV